MPTRFDFLSPLFKHICGVLKEYLSVAQVLLFEILKKAAKKLKIFRPLVAHPSVPGHVHELFGVEQLAIGRAYTATEVSL